MKLVRRMLDKMGVPFEKGGRLHGMYPLFEAIDTLLFTPGFVTKGRIHVRDGMDLKRLMITVVAAMTPAILWAIFNTGYQANLAVEKLVASGGSVESFALDNWQTSLYLWMGLDFSSKSIGGCIVHGLLYYLPVLIVTLVAGGFWEVLFASVRGHEVNEGFFVTAFLFPMIVPPAISLWQVAMGVSFGVVLGKEVSAELEKISSTRPLSGALFFFSPILRRYPATQSGLRHAAFLLTV